MSAFPLRLLRSAAVVTVALLLGGGVGCSLIGPPKETGLRQLIAASTGRPSRPSLGRFTGGFAYAAPPASDRGVAKEHVPPEIWTAVAALQATARADSSPARQAELAVGWATVGDFDRAARILELAILQDPRNATFHCDLSAVYLARGETFGVVEDWSNALGSATRATNLDRNIREAQFNHAISLERLHLRTQAIEQWTEFLATESHGEWAKEARDRRRALSAPPVSTSDSQDLRERLEDEILPAWGQAFDEGRQTEAAEQLIRALDVANQLNAADGDQMARTELMRIEQLKRTHRQGDLRILAKGFVLYGRARHAYLKDLQREAADTMTQAAVLFSRVASPYRFWAPIYRSIYFRNQGKFAEALANLSEVPLTSVPANFFSLRGREAWARGVALSASSGYQKGREPIVRALAFYRRAGETDNAAATETLVAEADWILGNRRSAWEHILSTIAVLDARGKSRRSYHFGIAANLARAGGNVEAEIAFDSARLLQAETDRARAEALHNRAKAYARAVDWTAARRDLESAEAAVNALTDPVLRERNAADVQIARATLLQSSDPRTAVDQATRALAYVTRATPAIRLVPLLLLRARSREALGDADGAQADLMSALKVFESKRAGFLSPSDRIQGFEQERAVYKALIRHALVIRADPAEGLRAAERSRHGTLLRPTNEQQDKTSVDPVLAPSDIPTGVAILFFEILDDRLALWVLTHEAWHCVVRPIDTRAIEAAVARVNRLISDGATHQDITADGRLLFRTLIEPALPFVGHRQTFFFVPDGILHQLPFAVLPDNDGRPLLMTRHIGIAASVSSFLSSTSRLHTFAADSVLALGDGHDPVTSGLPRLALADDEARAIGQLYPTRTVLPGAAASIRSLLTSTQPVIHFAGHTVLNREFPLFSHLLLAPEQGDGGMLLASEIAGHRFSQTRVIVLATCEAAAGRAVDGEGLVSVATAFLSAGVPAVVASLWPVSDADARRLFLAFHRELRSSGDAVSALRAAQLEILRQRLSTAPIKEWGGFVAMGGSAAIQ